MRRSTRRMRSARRCRRRATPQSASGSGYVSMRALNVRAHAHTTLTNAASWNEARRSVRTKRRCAPSRRWLRLLA